MGHTLFNALGVAYMLPIVWLGWYSTAVEYITPFALTQKTIMVHIAVAHSLFNIFNTIVFVPVIGWLEYVVLKIIPVKKDEIEEKPVVLEKRLLNTPVLALDQARREIVRMTQRAKKACLRAMEGLIEDDVKKLEKVRKSEDLLDSFQDEITSYLVALSREQLSDEVSQELPVLLHTVNDLERIGDHAINIVEIAERKIEKKIVFSDSAKGESGLLQKEICEMLDKMIIALENNDKDAARSALVNEDALNRMQMDFRRSHVQRITENVCSPEAGLIFIDLVNNVEKMGDHLTNIAQATIGGLHWDKIEEASKS
ncbi:MAG: Na/Pi cotransporter family protein [Candidatus Brocadiia bacterium]|nr:MAG: Na/Pi cotransporter family protein [Candidatus Brocadiia bacterium]